MKLLSRLLIAALSWLALPCLAEPEVSFRAVCFDPSQAAPPEFHLGSGEAREAIRIPKNDIGGPYKAVLRDGNMVDFFDSASSEKPAFAVKVPAEGQERLLLIIVPNGKDKGYQGSAVALPATGFNGGSTFAFNLCRGEIAVRQGEGKPEQLPSGSHRLLSLPTGVKDDMVAVQILAQIESKWQPVQSTRWAADRRFRSYLFLYTTPKGKVTLQAIPERLP